MPGMTPDPASHLDIIEVLKASMREDVAPALADAAREALVVQSAPSFEVTTRYLAAGETAILVGADRARVRMLVRATVDEIYIGSIGQLATGFGYPLPTASGDELKTTEEVYVLYAPAGQADPDARVSVWIERDPKRV